MIPAVFADVCLGLAAAVVLASGLGIAVMPDVYTKLHFVSPAAVVAPVLVTLAVLAREGLDENTGETVLALLFVVIAGPFLTHATIRAAQTRDRRADAETGPAPAAGPAGTP